MPVKLIALDIDGTLLDSRGELPAENALAISEVVDRGAKVILVTGRRWGTARKISALLNLPFPLVAHNGALIKCPITSNRLAASFIDPKIAKEILLTACKYQRYTVLHRDETNDGQTVIHTSGFENPRIKSYLEQFPDSVLSANSLADSVDPQLIQIMFGGELGAMQKIEELLLGSGLLEDVRLTKTYYLQKDLGIIDLLNANCSKAEALQFLARSYGLSRQEVMAIGDNHNDLEMLEYAGIGVVVANCVDELKGRGFLETFSNNEAGVAHALRQFVR